MTDCRRSFGFASVLLLASAMGGRAQDLTPTSFLQRGTAPAMVKPVEFQMSLGISTEYNSNITLSDSVDSSLGSVPGNVGASNSSLGSKSDLVSEAQLTLSGAWFLTEQSQLSMAIDFGYQKYLNHTDLDGIVMDLPTALSYSFTTGDLKWTIHDSLTVSNDASNQPELSGIDKFGELTNDAGLDVAFAAGSRITLSAGYERYDYYSTTSGALATSGPSNLTSPSASDSLDHSSDSVQFAAIYDLVPSARTGLGASMTNTSYSDDSRGSSTAYAVGPFFNATLTPATKVFASAGYQVMNGDSGGDNWYGSLEISNQLNRIYSQTLDASHSVGLGIVSDTFALDSLRYAGNLELRRDVTLTLDVFVDHGTEQGGGIDEKLTQYGGGLTVRVQLTRAIQGSIGWEHIGKSSNIVGRSYQQDRVFSSLSWAF